MCFTRVSAVKAEDPKEAAKGILARAAARGIIAGVQEKLNAVQEDHSTRKQTQRKEAKRKSKKTNSKPEDDINMTKKPSSVRLMHSEFAVISDLRGQKKSNTLKPHQSCINQKGTQ